VDIVGLPCDYEQLLDIVNDTEVKSQFQPTTEAQRMLGRILVMPDAAHSLGAWYKGKRTGALADISVFSFHAVKNLTTAEGGAICLNLPEPFDMDTVYKEMSVSSLHGQTKDALAKTKAGGWRYDVTSVGYKCNMTDVAAAMGLVELARYDQLILPRRKQIFDAYNQAFSNDKHFRVPTYETPDKCSSYHVFTLRVNGVTEEQRDTIIFKMSEKGVAANVHFIPLPLLTVYKSLGYKIEDYPNAYRQYACEISLPVYFDLMDEQVAEVIRVTKESVSEVCSL
jgi:dTDP-4-amino-4,6-dideoxygalactose transaminase